MSSSRRTVQTALLSAGSLESLRDAAREIESWPAGSHVWGHYAEQTAHGQEICRTENVSACHPAVAELVAGALREAASAALGEPATAFKDKVNYKQPGGAGFRPHQDKLAYPGVDRVMSILLAIDECTAESGCIWLADDVDRDLPTDDRGVVRDDIAESLAWHPAELAPGDAVFLDGLTPHYSEANRGDRARRVLVASYSPEREGYSRDSYYAARAETMADASARDGRYRISTLADFEGTEVATVSPASGRCTHDPALR